jgi:hypothetical protein
VSPPIPPIPIVVDPIIPPIIIPTPPPTDYIQSDFGENAINNHNYSDSWHSEKNQVIFDYVTKDFRNRCTSYQTYRSDLFTNNYIIPASEILPNCKKVKADIVFTPYVNSAYWENAGYGGFVLPVGSHYDNDGQGDIQVGSDNNRHDITSGPTVFLSQSIAVSARRDTPELFKNSTSEGYGMEFFEDCSPTGLDSDYPNADIPAALAQVTTDETGTIVTSQHNLGFTQYATVGEKITVYNTVTNTHEDTYIQEFLTSSSIRISPAVTPISQDYIYIWKYVTLGQYCGAEQESWAVPLIAGKLKVIKMSTNSDWNTVRMAARATAKRNPTGISEIDNTNWDMYRGFGSIQVNAAINYINNL